MILTSELHRQMNQRVKYLDHAKYLDQRSEVR